ncbi:MAG TPA: hypothetical protein VFB96_06210 [Pirellulaceae bacterium]|nr:hypothetical protein [Pirellulaceae bacterium]
MLRYIVQNRKTGTTERLYDSLGEAIGNAVKLIDEGGDANIIDSQGSGAIEVHRFDLLEAEGYVLRALGSETFDKPLPIHAVLDAARKRRKERPTIYHWDVGNSDYR